MAKSETKRSLIGPSVNVGFQKSQTFTSKRPAQRIDPALGDSAAVARVDRAL
jgi:hypothetical protein